MKKLNQIIAIGILCFCFIGMQAQDVEIQEEIDYSKKTKEIGLNMSGLVAQFVPFASAGKASGPFGITWLSGRSETYFRVSLGGTIGAEEAFFSGGNVGHLALGVGFTRRKRVLNNWIYESSVMGMGYINGLNFPGADGSETAGLGLGIGFAPGYELSDRVRINAEVLLFIGLGTNAVHVIVVPPVAINLKYRFVQQ